MMVKREGGKRREDDDEPFDFEEGIYIDFG